MRRKKSHKELWILLGILLVAWTIGFGAPLVTIIVFLYVLVRARAKISAGMKAWWRVLRRELWMLGIALALALIAMLVISLSFERFKDWPMYRHDPAHTGYTPAKGPKETGGGWWWVGIGEIWSSPAVVERKVYVASGENYFYCLDSENGDTIWKKEIDSVSSPAVVEGRVYVAATYEKRVYCLDAQTGEVIWSQPTLESVYTSPAVIDGRVYICDTQNIYVLNASNGELAWRKEIGFGLESPAVFKGRIYVGDSNYFYCISAENGDILWSQPIGKYLTSGYGCSSAAVKDGKVYVSTRSPENKVHCFGAENGEEVWSYYNPTSQFMEAPAVANGKVYVGDWVGNLYCLDANTGHEIWRFNTGYRGWVFAPIVASDRVYVGDHSFGLHCLDADTGEVVWRWEGDVVEGLAVANGRLYACTHGGDIICFGPPIHSSTIGISFIFLSIALGAWLLVGIMLWLRRRA